MGPIRIFVSSVQREFAVERKALAEYIRTDALLGRFFEVFIFLKFLYLRKCRPSLGLLLKYILKKSSSQMFISL